jgi:hypothetical protein
MLASPALGGGAGDVRGGIRYAPEPVLEGLSERAAVITAPDGRSVYYLGGYDARTTVAVVRRDPRSGLLVRPARPDGCVVAWIARARGRTCRSGPALNNSTALAVAPDGRDVAVGGHAVAQIALFRRTARGGLRFGSCVGVGNGGFPCARARGVAVTNALAFSGDGRNLYAGSRGLLVFARDPATGKLRQLPGADGCIQRAGRTQPETPPCATVPASLFGPSQVIVTPNNRMLIVPSNGGLFVFSRDPSSGALTLLRCYGSSARPPCDEGPPIGAPMLLTPDGRTLVGLSEGPDESGRVDVARFNPATGAITTLGCFATMDGDCKQVVVPSWVSSVAIGPDGRTLYIGGQYSLRAYRLAADTLARLPGPSGCVSSVRAAGCALIDGPRPSGFGSLVTSPDGRWLYGAGGIGLAFRIVR